MTAWLDWRRYCVFNAALCFSKSAKRVDPVLSPCFAGDCAVFALASDHESSTLVAEHVTISQSRWRPMLIRFFVLQEEWTSRIMVKAPCTCRSPTRVTCTVSQNFGVPDCHVSENHSQEFSRAASVYGVRYKCQDMPFDLNMCMAPTRSSAACMKILTVSARAHDEGTFALTVRHLCLSLSR